MESIRTAYPDRVEWRNEQGDLHRVDGPAREWSNGDKDWFLNGKCHREDGPAVVWPDGGSAWYLNDKCHRVDGPAVEYINGGKEYWVNGKYYSEQEYNEEMLNIRLRRLMEL